jgi:hypothetical protein
MVSLASTSRAIVLPAPSSRDGRLGRVEVSRRWGYALPINAANHLPVVATLTRTLLVARVPALFPHTSVQVLLAWIGPVVSAPPVAFLRPVLPP